VHHVGSFVWSIGRRFPGNYLTVIRLSLHQATAQEQKKENL